MLGCVGLIVIGMQPPNETAAYAVGGFLMLLAVGWLAGARSRILGPPPAVLDDQQS